VVRRWWQAETVNQGLLVLAATPIGNVLDASARLRDLLETADVVAAEDTRRLQTLAQRMGVRVGGRLLSFHEHNEASRLPELLTVVGDGGRVVVVTDAGMPSVSDPGFRAVAAAAAAGLRVTVAPGPSAVLTALALSGLPTDRFCFEGFLPRRAGERGRALAALVDEPRTVVLFEAPHRVAALLEHAVQVLGPDRPAAVCRELTKVHEEVRRGVLGELAAWAGQEQVRGEIVVVLGGAARGPGVIDDVLVATVLSRVDGGEKLSAVTADEAARARVSRRDLYGAVVAARQT
jgi:16S rRNA (cytidine1402-2'-O)-methyltransferase